MQDLKQKFIRDFTSVMPRSKSEAKRRLDEISEASYREGWKDAIQKMQDEMDKFTQGFNYRKPNEQPNAR